MDTKTYEQMRAEFCEFYKIKVKPRLAEYEAKRRAGAPKIFAFYATWFSFITGVASLMFSQKVPILTSISGILMGIAICSCIWLCFLTRNDPKDSRGATVIKSNFEYDLKLYLMKYFLEIFSPNANWGCGLLNGYWEKIRNYKKNNIFNPFPYALFDDTIFLIFKDIEINIFEVNTAIFNKITIMLIPFLFVWLSGVFSLQLVIVLFIIFIIKYLRYAPFRGIVVELKMNKNFKGHTFFLDKSLNSKKIAVDSKKYENIKLESVDFMKKYNVFSTDQVEARYILTTSMIDRLENLKLYFHANFIRGSFKDNKFIIAIETDKDMFAMGSDFKETNLQTFNNLFNEIVSILKIIDQLKLNEKTGL